MSQINPKKHDCHGFTLVETLVALFILSIAVTGALAVITYNLQSATMIKNTFIANGLVQEGMEVTRNIRDSDWIQGKPFGSFGASARINDGTYRAQWNDASIHRYGYDVLYVDAKGLYNYETGTPTMFSRGIGITKISETEIKIFVQVSWKERNLDKSVSAEEHLFNWY